MKKDDAYWKKRCEESEWGMLIVPPKPKLIIGEAKPCHTCNKNLRHLLKSGKYDAYCLECRSEMNKRYGRETRSKLAGRLTGYNQDHNL